jgi:Glutathione-dependent formaldehyde-activating enzyme
MALDELRVFRICMATAIRALCCQISPRLMLPAAIAHCRKHHGALFHGSAVFPEDAVTVEGETREYKGRFFCPRCGSGVFGHYRDETEVNLGSFDAIDQLKPTYESGVIRRESWLPPFPLAISHERDRNVTRRFDD